MPSSTSLQRILEVQLDAFLHDNPSVLHQSLHMTWQQLQSQLQEYGISDDASQSNKSYIMGRIEDVACSLRNNSHIRPSTTALESEPSSDRLPPYAEVSRAPSTLLPTTYNASLHSPNALLRHNSSFSSTSTLRAQSMSHLSAENNTTAMEPRRATVAYLADLRAARRPPKPEKTTGRKAFEVLCKGVEIVVPLDIDEQKTRFRDSHMVQMFGRTER